MACCRSGPRRPHAWNVLARFSSDLLVEIIGIENQRLAPGIENATVRLFGFAGAGHVIDFRDVQIAGAHQFADIPVVGQEFISLFECSLLLLKLTGEIADLGLRCLGTGSILSRLLGKRVQFFLQRAGIVLRRFELFVLVRSFAG